MPLWIYSIIDIDLVNNFTCYLSSNMYRFKVQPKKLEHYARDQNREKFMVCQMKSV